MPRGPSSAHSLQRDTILNISADTFAELTIKRHDGATRPTLRRVENLLYHYYTSKDAILYDLMQAYMSQLRSLVIEVASRDLPAREALAERRSAALCASTKARARATLCC